MIRLHCLQMSASKSLLPDLSLAPNADLSSVSSLFLQRKFFQSNTEDTALRQSLGGHIWSSLLHKGINGVKKKKKSNPRFGNWKHIKEKVIKMTLPSKGLKSLFSLKVELLILYTLNGQLLCFHIQSIKWDKKASVHTTKLSANSQSQTFYCCSLSR